MDVNKGLMEYLSEKNIYVMNEYFKGGLKKEEEIIAQIKLIAEVQKILWSFNTRSYSGIKSYIGREINRVKTAYVMMKSIELGNEFTPLMEKLEEINNKIKDINLKKIVKRSVDRKEITIGKLDERNIRVLDEIEIGKIKKVAYSLIEDDVVTYLNRVKKAENKSEVDKFIVEYVRKANLDVESYKYIKTMLEVPNLCIEYIEKNKSKLDKEKLFEIMKKEGIV
ncbi:MAG: hypothetical protein ACRC28_09995 [Clostridium sp.]|uniref:hypothetical protein n=1 Tax=Clostridium sp. TaxID=1506 RepID=UPI003F29FC45